MFFLSLCLLVFFADHLAQSLQVDAIMAVVERNTQPVIGSSSFVEQHEAPSPPLWAVPVPAPPIRVRWARYGSAGCTASRIDADLLRRSATRAGRLLHPHRSGQRKEIIETHIAEIKIEDGQLLPIFKIPAEHDERPADEPADREPDPTFRTMAHVVEPRGLEPLTPTLPVWCATSCATAPGRPVARALGAIVHTRPTPDHFRGSPYGLRGGVCCPHGGHP
jgi:hypothetical protein